MHHPAISDWRRAVAGDIISAFNFDAPPDLTWPTLPDTSAYPAESNTECKTLPPPKAPAVQAMPTQVCAMHTRCTTRLSAMLYSMHACWCMCVSA